MKRSSAYSSSVRQPMCTSLFIMQQAAHDGLIESKVFYYENNTWNPSAKEMSTFEQWPVASNQQMVSSV